MVKEELVLKIREEYQGYAASSIESVDAVNKYMDEVFEYFEKLEKEFKSDIKYNKKCIKESNRLGAIRKMFGYKAVDFYEKDINIIEQEMVLVDRFEDCYERLSNDIFDKNFKEVYKLARFAKYKFHCNFEHLEEARRNNELLYDGLYFNSFKIKDDSEEFIEFFDEEIDNVM